jgi:alkylation response protein AidB-like acyl-CoA dehydrogenase
MVAFGASPGRKAGLLDRRAGEVARGLVTGPRQFGGALGDPASLVRSAAEALGRTKDPVLRQGLAWTYTRAEIQRFSDLRSAAAVRAGRSPGAEGSVRKLARSELVRTAREVGMAALGAAGMLVGPATPGEGELQQLCLSSPGTSIAGGTDEIQRTIVGERVLGLPREPRVDRDLTFRELDARSSGPGP